MKADLKEKWVKALRSGEYEQTTGQLRYDPSFSGRRNPSYCCLGVLCEVLGAKYDPSGGLPKTSVLDSAGVSADKADKLAQHNDHGRSFNWIAGYIQRYL